MSTTTLKREIATLRAEYDRILAAHQGRAVPRHIEEQLVAMDKQLEQKLDEFTKAQTADKERGYYQDLFGQRGTGEPIGDGSRRTRTDGGFAEAIFGAGFDLHNQASVTIPLSAAVGLPSDPGVYSRRTLSEIQPQGRDTRFAWPLLPVENIGNETSIEDFRQTGTRDVTGSVQRALAATTDKASLDVGIAHVQEPLVQMALLIEDIPNVVLSSIERAQDFFQDELAYQINTAIDAHFTAQVSSAEPPSGKEGVNLLEQIRYAIAAMRGAGTDPTVALVSPSDAVALDLFKQPGTEDYAFPSRAAGEASPVWGLQVYERTGDAEETPPLLLDPTRLGRMYLGTLRFEADPYTGFKQNTTTLRLEVNCLAHIRNPVGAYLIDDGEE